MPNPTKREVADFIAATASKAALDAVAADRYRRKQAKRLAKSGFSPLSHPHLYANDRAWPTWLEADRANAAGARQSAPTVRGGIPAQETGATQVAWLQSIMRLSDAVDAADDPVEKERLSAALSKIALMAEAGGQGDLIKAVLAKNANNRGDISADDLNHRMGASGHDIHDLAAQMGADTVAARYSNASGPPVANPPGVPGVPAAGELEREIQALEKQFKKAPNQLEKQRLGDALTMAKLRLHNRQVGPPAGDMFQQQRVREAMAHARQPNLAKSADDKIGRLQKQVADIDAEILAHPNRRAELTQKKASVAQSLTLEKLKAAHKKLSI